MADNQRTKQRITPALEKNKWKKGQSGNPKGRPKKPFCIPEILRKISAEVQDGNLSNLEALLREVYRRALKGEGWAVNFVADRLEGKPKAAYEIQIEEPKPITIIKDEW